MITKYERALTDLLQNCSLHEVISLQMDSFEDKTGKLPVLLVLDKALLPAALRAFDLLDSPLLKTAERIVLYIEQARVMFSKLPDGEYMHTLGADHTNKLVL